MGGRPASYHITQLGPARQGDHSFSLHTESQPEIVPQRNQKRKWVTEMRREGQGWGVNRHVTVARDVDDDDEMLR